MSNSVNVEINIDSVPSPNVKGVKFINAVISFLVSCNDDGTFSVDEPVIISTTMFTDKQWDYREKSEQLTGCRKLIHSMLPYFAIKYHERIIEEARQERIREMEFSDELYNEWNDREERENHYGI